MVKNKKRNDYIPNFQFEGVVRFVKIYFKTVVLESIR